MHLLFVCPHGAAKSVMATAIARELFARKGLGFTCASAGTDPDECNNPVAIAELKAHGLDHTDEPRRLRGSDLASADAVITFGVAGTDLPGQPLQLIDWSDVPDASVDAVGLFSILTERVRGLVDGLIARPSS